tara:strand:- start:325 stop:588 length:264 start_codon:yes stop_codon:yes gene_type:complete
MFKEIKYFIYIFFILMFFFFIGKYYFSDSNKKKSYRSLIENNDRIKIYAKKLPVLEDDTKGIIEYVEKSNSKKKKKFNFWKLLDFND